MSTSLAIQRTASTASERQWAFAVCATSIAIASCALAGFAPLGFSIIAVFLFAGPHNWLEARYMLTRMPARWGPLRRYFLVGMIGVPLLMGAFAAMPWLLPRIGAGHEGWSIAVAGWNTALVVWVLILIQLRKEQPPRRQWPWAWPVGLALIAANWIWPVAGSLLLVYAHPLVALWFLDREIGRQRPEWQRAYRGCLALVPVLLGMLWWRLAGTPDLAGDDVLTLQITNHAGAGVLQGVSTHLLVATHVFLEMLHYGVWVLAIPLVSIRTLPWRLDNVPLAHKSQLWRHAVLAMLALGVVIVFALWGAFLADYPLTRDVYFTVALLHVLAEVPFLLRLL